MLPHMGAGAGQGIEDAYLLARLLALPETTTDNVEVCIRIHFTFSRLQPRTDSAWFRLISGCFP